MSKLSRDLTAGTLHPREVLFTNGNLGALNAEVITPCDSCGTVAIDLRGTFNLTVEVSGTVDGSNWTLIPVKPITGGIYLAAIVGSALGVWVGDCSGFRQVRARVTAFTSGTATTVIAASNTLISSLVGEPVVQTATITAAAGALTTLSIGAPGAGLRHYITNIQVQRFAAALLVAAAAPVVVTTTNLPTGLAFSVPADAAAQGAIATEKWDFPEPLISSAQNTATTIVCPATTNVIWRATAAFYIAP